MVLAKRVAQVSLALLILPLLCLTALAPTPALAADDAPLLNVATSMADNLAALKGKVVTVFLASGQNVTGAVAEVKGNLLRLTKLSQKDFYDGLVVIDRISAIEVKVR